MPPRQRRLEAASIPPAATEGEPIPGNAVVVGGRYVTAAAWEFRDHFSGVTLHEHDADAGRCRLGSKWISVASLLSNYRLLTEPRPEIAMTTEEAVDALTRVDLGSRGETGYPPFNIICGTRWEAVGQVRAFLRGEISEAELLAWIDK